MVCTYSGQAYHWLGGLLTLRTDCTDSLERRHAASDSDPVLLIAAPTAPQPWCVL